MVNLLISVILAGLATTFALELIYLAVSWFLDKDVFYNILSLPVSFGAMVCLNSLAKSFFVTVPATAFIVLVVNKWLNSPKVFNYQRRNLPRL